MGERTLEDYARLAVSLPGAHPGWLSMLQVYWNNPGPVVDHEGTAWLASSEANRVCLHIDHPGNAGLMEPLLGADLVTWDSREDTRGIEVTWPDGDHVYIHCETKGRGLVLAAEYRGRWDGGVA